MVVQSVGSTHMCYDLESECDCEAIPCENSPLIGVKYNKPADNSSRTVHGQ